MTSDILIIDDEEDIRSLISTILNEEGYKTRQAGNVNNALEELKSRAPSVVLLDIWLEGASSDGIKLLKQIRELRPKTQVIMISGHGTIEIAVKAMKMGAYDFIEKPFESERLLILVKRAIENSKLLFENMELRARAEISDDLIGTCTPVENLRRNINRVAPTGSRVLISGPAGVGKEVVARLIHKSSKRKEGPFIAVNCARLLPEKFSQIFFGDNESIISGVFDQSDGGTLFLDEVSDIPYETQGRLIRLLQEQKFERQNASGIVEVDVRVIAASSKNLSIEVSEGRFREELYYRLSVVPIKVPSLSERREDIPLFVDYFMKLGSHQTNLPSRKLAEDALAALQNYPWPGNVRQLRNIIDWLLIMAPGDSGELIRSDMLPADIVGDVPMILSLRRSDEILKLPLREARELFEREYLLSQVRKYGGNISKTAESIAMDRSALHRKLKVLGITRDIRVTNENDDGILLDDDNINPANNTYDN